MSENSIMTTRRYQFRFHGLEEHGGEIKAADLARALNALHKVAESATTLLVSGEGRRRRGKPTWLAAATDFTVTGLTSGSTVVALTSARLLDAPNSPLGRGGLLSHREIETDDTALDLVARAIREAQVADSPGNWFDGAVLDAILELAKSVRTGEVSYSLSRRDAAEPNFVLSRGACSRMVERKRNIPLPRAFIVSGRVKQIAHTRGHFQLEVSTGRNLYGRLHADANDVELLQPLWGKQATVQGLVHFKANGQPRMIEAQRISAGQADDHLFAEIPHNELATTKPLPKGTQRARAWPNPWCWWGHGPVTNRSRSFSKRLARKPNRVIAWIAFCWTQTSC